MLIPLRYIVYLIAKAITRPHDAKRTDMKNSEDICNWRIVQLNKHGVHDCSKSSPKFICSHGSSSINHLIGTLNMLQKIATFAVASLISFGNSAYAGTFENWEFTYENDSNGNALYGNIGDLAAAIKQGRDVKVVGIIGSGAIDDAIAFSTIANTVGVTQSNIVYARSTIYPSSTDESGLPTLSENVKQVQMFKSTGVREILQYNAAETTVISHQNTNLRMRWYINK